MSVESIHQSAFDGCPKLKIIAEAGSAAAEYEAQRDKSNVANKEYQDVGAETEGEAGKDGESAEGSEGSGTGEKVLGQSTIVGGNAVVFMDNSQSKVLSGNERPDTGEVEEQLPAGAEIMGGAGITLSSNIRL